MSGSVCLLLLSPIISDKIWFSLAPGNNQLSRETKKSPSFYFLSCLHLQYCLFIIIVVTNLRQNLVFIGFAQETVVQGNQEASFILLPFPAYISSTFLRILADTSIGGQVLLASLLGTQARNQLRLAYTRRRKTAGVLYPTAQVESSAGFFEGYFRHTTCQKPSPS